MHVFVVQNFYEKDLSWMEGCVLCPCTCFVDMLCLHCKEEDQWLYWPVCVVTSVALHDYNLSWFTNILKFIWLHAWLQWVTPPLQENKNVGNFEMWYVTVKMNRDRIGTHCMMQANWRAKRAYLVVQLAHDFHIYIYVCIGWCILVPRINCVLARVARELPMLYAQM